MDRRKFILNTAKLSAGGFIASSGIPVLRMNSNVLKATPGFSHRLPESDGHYLRTCGYIEDVPVKEYTWAPDSAYEDFLDMKFGIRVHWGIYSILQCQNESWSYLGMPPAERHTYDSLFKSWYPEGFDADQWVDFFGESGAKMFSFTTKHHDGFSMYDTSTRVKKRVNWLSPDGPELEDCDLSYSIMETPFKRDVVKELCDASHKKGMKIDLYFSHPDWYDADFRPYTYHPLQVPDADKLSVTGKNLTPLMPDPASRFGKSGVVIVPDSSKKEVDRMMHRHRRQLEELITKYGNIDMVCLDMFLGPEVWPQLRETMLYLRKLRPSVMYRARGIGNYGDYYTPEGFVPGSKENTDTPWFVIYPLGKTFSYDPESGNYKGTKWIIRNLIDAVAKGGNFMVGIGPDGSGKFHPASIKQLKETGAWLSINAEGIYATRPRDGALWQQGEDIRFTRSKDHSTVYVFSFKWPGEKLTIQSVKPHRNAKIYLMGIDRPLKWTYDKTSGLVIEVPDRLINGLSEVADFSFGFKIPV